jgi:hypothetical protein
MTRRTLYARVLRLRHLRLRPLVAFLLFKGSVALGILLALADFVTVWAVLVIPATVAVMVKVNDVIAGGLNRPLAVAQLRTPRPRDSTAVGRSRVPTPQAPGATTVVPAAAPRPEKTRAIARVVARGRAKVRGREEPPSGDTIRPDGADRRNRGNTGRFAG